MTATEKAKLIRQELKAHGWNRNMVSVRTRHGGFSSAIYVTCKDPSVDVAVVEKLTRKYEHYQRCPRTQEILMGGNDYVFVS